MDIRRFAITSTIGILAYTAAAATTLPNPVGCTGCFIGELRLSKNSKDDSGKTKVLDDDLYFVDLEAFVWKAGKGDVTDGASIPELFRGIIGPPFEADYLPAAVIHDHYTDRAHRVRTWRDTDRVFFQAMIANGVPTAKAKTMYYAVYAFGPHWDTLAKGTPCGQDCLYSEPINLGVEFDGDVVKLNGPASIPEGFEAVEQPANYDIEHQTELDQLLSQIQQQEIRGTPLSLDDIDRLAQLRHGDNLFIAKYEK